jgi:hypothetical protein
MGRQRSIEPWRPEFSDFVSADLGDYSQVRDSVDTGIVTARGARDVLR